jgi:quinol monooxygenase YgiN
MVSVKMKLPVETKSKGRFLEAVRSVIEPIRVEEGCHQYGVYEDIENRDSVLLVQEWSDGDSLSRHIQGDRFRTLLIAMDMLSGPPEVLVIDVQDSRALRTIEELFDRLCRGADGPFE